MEDNNDSRAAEWSVWKCTAFTAFLCGIPMLFIARVGVLVLAVWFSLIILYCGLLWMFGKGFVVHGAIVVIILSILAAIVLPKMSLAERQPQEKSEQIEKIENASNNWVQWTIC